MNLAEQNQLAEKFFDECRKLLVSKGTDYTPEDIAFKDLDSIATKLNIKDVQVLYVYMRKHWTAIEHFIQHGNVKSEPVDSRLIDMANYCALMYVLINRKS